MHTLSPVQVLELLGTGLEGLSHNEARERLSLYGPNVLVAARQISPWLILWRQFQNLLIAILIVATAVSFLMGESLDAWVILAIVLACVVLGFIQVEAAKWWLRRRTWVRAFK